MTIIATRMWETFIRPSKRRKYKVTSRREPSVTVNGNGCFVLNAAATRLLEDASTVIYAYDRETQTIAMIPSAPDVPDTFKITRSRYTTRVAGRSFLNYFNIDRSQIKDVPCRLEDGRLLIQMKGRDDSPKAR